jgi:hypothetical protein
MGSPLNTSAAACVYITLTLSVSVITVWLAITHYLLELVILCVDKLFEELDTLTVYNHRQELDTLNHFAQSLVLKCKLQSQVTLLIPLDVATSSGPHEEIKLSCIIHLQHPTCTYYTLDIPL